MAKAKTVSSAILPKIVEASVTVQSRGRSVVTGTIAYPNGELKTFRHEFLGAEKSELEEMIAGWLAHSVDVKL